MVHTFQGGIQKDLVSPVEGVHALEGHVRYVGFRKRSKILKGLIDRLNKPQISVPALVYHIDFHGFGISEYHEILF